MAVKYRSKTDLVADEIKAMIERGELTCGDELHQREIADLLGVSPTPVREAFRRLEAEGFVGIEPHRPAVVMRPDADEIYANAMMLGVLEGLGAELAAKRVTPSDLAVLRDLNERLRTAATDSERIALDREFHLRICKVTGYTYLVAQLNVLWRMIGASPHLVMPIEEWIDQHDVIIDALAAGDCSEAREATNSHVFDGFRDLAPSTS